ncbi:MAG TPA: GTP-binding protein [Clostridia bacterium]|nr:GTP-binding protein [Clostridia bacterium]
MAAEIYIVSGFLGAGKTTLIQKLLKESFQGKKVALVENDFGDISVDAALLRDAGVEVTELNTGCICCTLSGDFVKALHELLTRHRPDVVLIEPSGVGKLSDVEAACADPCIAPLAKGQMKITVADVQRCQMYLDNFGEFFEDQIENADVVVLSRVDQAPEKAAAARALVQSLNAQASIVALPFDDLTAEAVLFPQIEPPAAVAEQGHSCGCCGHGHHEHAHEHGADCTCGCRHDADEVFDTLTLRIRRAFSPEDLGMRMAILERPTYGTVLRAKGILRGPKGYINLQYLPGDLQWSECETVGDMLCIIGRNLNKPALTSLFGGA